MEEVRTGIAGRGFHVVSEAGVRLICEGTLNASNSKCRAKINGFASTHHWHAVITAPTVTFAAEPF